MLSIVLIGPEHPGNIGAIARVMDNFNLTSLFLVHPQCDHLSEEATNRATHGITILKKAKTIPLQKLKSFDVIIGTTARVGTDYNIRRSPLLPTDLARKISQIKSKKIALVFGRESRGLSNDEIALCDFLVTIPTAKKSPTLNLSHAVAIILYELSRQQLSDELLSPFAPISNDEKKILYSLIDKRLDAMTFPTPHKRETQKKVWRHVLGKAMLTKREAFALLGFFKKL
jgi:TrmH family RNA methyltransferase